MEVRGLSAAGGRSLETVRVLHETVVALRTALEGSRRELNELRSRFREGGGADGEEAADGRRDSDSEIDDIEVVFATEETDPGTVHEDLVPIREERKPLVETDISKCGTAEEARANAAPDPYRPLLHREVLAARSSPRKVQESAAQTDITAVPGPWKSETHLARRMSSQLTTLPSRFVPPQARGHLPVADKTTEARRILLSDIDFTSRVPELSRSADHLHREECHPAAAAAAAAACLFGWGSGAERRDSRSSWGSRYPNTPTSVPAEDPRRFFCCHVWSSVPSFACRGLRADPGRSLPDLRPDCDSGDSTDSLIDEAEEYLRRSIDNLLPRRDRRPPRPYLPRSPAELGEDALAKVIAADGRVVLGRIRFAGPVVGQSEPYVGVELQSATGGSDGTFLGRRYFYCDPDHALFVPFKKVVLAWHA